LVENLKVDRERALAELNADWTCTQEIADGLVRNANVDFRTGHGFASALVTWARTNGKTPASVQYEEVCACWREWAKEKNLALDFPLNEEKLRASLDPALILAHRRTVGSASPAMIAEQLEAANRKVNQFQEWVTSVLDFQKKVCQTRKEALTLL
jgi:hypothetical protein